MKRCSALGISATHGWRSNAPVLIGEGTDADRHAKPLIHLVAAGWAGQSAPSWRTTARLLISSITRGTLGCYLGDAFDGDPRPHPKALK